MNFLILFNLMLMLMQVVQVEDKVELIIFMELGKIYLNVIDILKKMTLEDFLLQINVLFQVEEEMNLKILITLDTVQKWEI